MASMIAEKAPGLVYTDFDARARRDQGELKNINTRIDSLDLKIDSVRNELKADISRVDSRVEELDKRLDIV